MCIRSWVSLELEKHFNIFCEKVGIPLLIPSQMCLNPSWKNHISVRVPTQPGKLSLLFILERPLEEPALNFWALSNALLSSCKKWRLKVFQNFLRCFRVANTPNWSETIISYFWAHSWSLSLSRLNPGGLHFEVFLYNSCFSITAEASLRCFARNSALW